MLRVFIGYDEREQRAAEVAARTLHRVSGGQLEPEFLRADKLADQGLLTRISDHRGGQDYDLVSNAVKSTRFAVSRFLVPLLCQTGLALFVDCDIVFKRDPREMTLAPGKAIGVVQHAHEPTERYKMVNQAQTSYARKNWSSVMLFDCEHRANRRLSLRDINERPGRDLHALYWLHDSEVDALDPKWNWLVNVEPRPQDIGIAHFTLGGPFTRGWTAAPNDDIWLKEAT